MITIPASSNGPIDSGHGGFAAGRFAEAIDPLRAMVKLHRPIPLDTTLTTVAQADGATVTVAAGTDTIATVSALSGTLEPAPFQPVPAEQLRSAEAAWMAEGTTDHPCPTCYGCGTARTVGGGLGLRPGPVPGHGVHAASWSPNHQGDLAPWLIWAALDCPSGAPALAAVQAHELVLTATLSVDIRYPVPGDGQYQIIGRLDHRDDRKMRTSAALLDGGRTLAVAEALWIAVARPTREQAA